MLPDDTRSKLENIVAGVVIEGSEDNCTAIRNTLCSRFATSNVVKANFESNAIIKKEQACLIEEYCSYHDLWFSRVPDNDRYLTRGGEARVYLANDDRHVIKLNDAIYYATWLEFLNSIIIHNLIFSNTAYKLLGFVKEAGVLYAALEQTFVIATAQAYLGDIRRFLEFNEFKHTRRHDYINKRLGLILEDMHDENVLVNTETLFFIDSVFYTVHPQKF